MTSYVLARWVFYFFFYSLLGWIWECTYCSIVEKRITNRGFMKGPVIPIYGCGALTMVLASMPVKDKILLCFVAGMIAASALEFITGMLMEALFNVRYWDYSNEKFNIKGYVCLKAALCWGMATILANAILQKSVEKVTDMIPSEYLRIIVVVLVFIFAVDFTLSFSAALDIKDILAKMDAMKTEAIKMRKRLRTIVSSGEGKIDDSECYEDIVKALESEMEKTRDNNELTEENKAEISVFRAKISMMKDRVSHVMPFRAFLSRLMIKGNPGMVSSKYKESLEELKKRVIK